MGFEAQNVVLIMVSTAIVLGATSLFAIYLGRRTKSADDWNVGGRSLPFYVIVGTQYATAMGGGVLVAHVGIGYKSGWSVLTYGLLVAGGIAFFALLAPWLRKQNFTTLPDVLERFYGTNRFLKAVTAFACIIVPFGWIATQLVAFAKIFTAITGISMPILMCGFAVISVLFVIPAGLTSVAWTDFVFGLIMLAMSLFSAIYAVEMSGGWDKVVATVPASLISLPEGMFAVGGTTVALWCLAILPGTLTNQLYYQRIFAIQNVNLVRWSLVSSALVFFTAEIWAGFMGMSILTANPSLSPEQAAGWFLTQVPVWFLALYAGFVAATIVSTIDSAIQSSVVNMTHDIYKKLINPEVSDGKMLVLSRWLSVVVTAIALIWAIAWPEALGWLVASYAYSASVLLFPLFLGYFMRDSNFLTPQGAIAGMICGLVGCGIGQAMGGKVAGLSMPYVAYGLIASLAGLLVVSILTRRTAAAEPAVGQK